MSEWLSSGRLVCTGLSDVFVRDVEASLPPPCGSRELTGRSVKQTINFIDADWNGQGYWTLSSDELRYDTLEDVMRSALRRAAGFEALGFVFIATCQGALFRLNLLETHRHESCLDYYLAA